MTVHLRVIKVSRGLFTSEFAKVIFGDALHSFLGGVLALLGPSHVVRHEQVSAYKIITGLS